MDSHPVDPVGRRRHLAAHRAFVERIDSVEVLAVMDSSTAIEHLLAFLVKWLVHHVASVDARLAREILALRGGALLAPQCFPEAPGHHHRQHRPGYRQPRPQGRRTDARSRTLDRR